MNEEILLAAIDGLAAELAAGYTNLPPTAQGRILRLSESLSRVRLSLLKTLSAPAAHPAAPRQDGAHAQIPARNILKA